MPPPHWRRCSSYLSELVNETSERAPIPTDDNSQVSLGSTDNGSQLALVLALHVLNRQDSSGLLVDNGTKAGFPLYNDVGNTHLSAKCWEVDNQLDWVNIVSNDNQGRLLGLDESNSMIKPVLDEERFLRFLWL